MNTLVGGDCQFNSRYIDLLNEKIGGKALCCSDQWFAECANLVKDGRAESKPGYFISTGQWMDGWESRRSFGRTALRGQGEVDHDWCILRLGIAGVIYALDIDTQHFKGNAPEFVSVEAAFVQGDINEHTEWQPILNKSSVDADSQNLFRVNDERVFTHVRLNIYPDGGVARFRVYGDVRVDKANFVEGELIDLASVMNGGRGLDCSDRFYSSPNHLLLPGRGINMGDGWETKRRRDELHDWSIIKLGLIGSIRKVIIDTAHFKGNYPDRFSLEATYCDREPFDDNDIDWETVVAKTPLYADQEHIFVQSIEVPKDKVFTHVRLSIYPDGGVSRLRVMGLVDWSVNTRAY